MAVTRVETGIGRAQRNQYIRQYRQGVREPQAGPGGVHAQQQGGGMDAQHPQHRRQYQRQNHQAPKARSDSNEREAAIDVIMQRKDVPLTMPAWQGEPSVDAHILDLYAYLSARAQGRQDAGRPVQ